MLQTSLDKKVFFCCAFFFSQHFIYFLRVFLSHLDFLSTSPISFDSKPTSTREKIWGFRRSRIWFEASLWGSNRPALLGASNTTPICEKTTQIQLEQGNIQHEFLYWIQIQEVVWFGISKDFSEGDFWLRSFQHHLSIYLSNYLPTNLL